MIGHKIERRCTSDWRHRFLGAGTTAKLAKNR
jgi:hypothetical protein